MSRTYVISEGKTAVENLLKKVGDQPITYISSTWTDRPKSNIMKWLSAEGGVDVREMSDLLSLTVGSFNNKLVRGSFSLDEILLAATACGYTLGFIDNNNSKIYSLDPDLYFSLYKKDEYEEFQKKIRLNEHHMLIEELQAQIDQIESQKQHIEKQLSELESTLAIAKQAFSEG